MGTVYLCEHAVLHRRFAVKVLRADLAADQELVDRFRNEAIAASRIGQENVVDVVDFGTEEDGALYYVMEALEGRSLGAVIRAEGALGVGRALDLFEQLCRALAAAHARGVVHRDVKPDNVFIVPRGDGGELAKVIDFGISRLPGTGRTARITRAGSIIGPPEYMAPEQASGAAIDHRADVYAAGVLLFEMLTGELPLEAETPFATIVAHQTRTPDPPSRRVAGVPPDVDALVLRALAKRPADRFESMEALAAETARIRARLAGEGGRPTRSFGASASARPSRRGETVALPESRDDRRRRREGLRRAGVVIVVLAGAATGGWWWRVATEGGARAPAANQAATPIATLPPPAAMRPAAIPETPGPVAPPAPAHAMIPDTGATSARGPAAAAVIPAPAVLAAPSAPFPRTAVAAPPRQVLVGDASPLPGVAPKPARARRTPTPRKEAPITDGGLKDPYSDGARLKDPFE
jgi:serine/threonine-protein kinase